MSVIRPKNLITDENTPRAEIDIYNLFKEKLSDDYYVNYKRFWHGKNNKGKLFTREIDFIVALKNEGVLFVEVKGGVEIIYNPDEKNGYVYINYHRIWMFFKEVINIEYSEIQDIINKWLDETYNLTGLTPPFIMNIYII